MPNWTQATRTQGEVKVLILDSPWESLPRPPFSDDETETLVNNVYEFVWQRSMSGASLAA